MNFKYEPFLPIGNGILSKDELLFFYYDIVIKNEDSLIYMCEWSQEVKDFLNTACVNIQPCPAKVLATAKFQDNTIFYTKSNGESETNAFFRHLRNAFAHLHIQDYDGYLYLKDNNGKSITMIGKVKFVDLKQLCQILLKQVESINNNNNETF
jgi:hypothetical protein